jgi:UDP:flavonoid glycosyltransferase YjiC (YdhE family)
MSPPLILYAIPPREGHMRPALQISSHLVSRGLDVTMLGDAKWSPAITAIGAHPSPIIGLWGAMEDYTKWGDIIAAQNAEERLRISLSDGFVRLLPSGLESVRAALTNIWSRLGGGDVLKGRTVVILSDTCFSGTLPIKLGADLPQGYEGVMVKTVGIGLVPRFWAALERPPWASGLPYDVSEEGITRNLAAHARKWDEAAEERARWVLGAMNCSKSVDELYGEYDKGETGFRRPFWDASTVCHDVVFQMGLPSFEFPVPNEPAHLKFAGSLPPKPIASDLQYPDWYPEILENSSSSAAKPGRKRIVFVAQGTEVLDHRDLLVPCVKGLAGREDVLVVAVLCQKGATIDKHLSLFEGGKLPRNARVIDYFPYDAILPHADVFASNSGYGGLTHAVAQAVPVVQAGDVFDKPDIGRRVEYSGLGVFLTNSPPTPEDVAAAVDEVLAQDKYKKRALSLQAESREYDPLQIIEDGIRALS